MDQQIPTENKKSFWRNESVLVCGMLVFYGVCILGLVGAVIWGLGQRSRRIAANAASTAFAVATQEVRATATAAARITEQADYEIVETFSTNSEHWEYGAQNSEYWTGSKVIANGVYIWNVDKVKKTFISRQGFYRGKSSKDFDVYVDTKIVEGNPGEVCTGLLFRTTLRGWQNGTYAFSLCNNSYFEINYRDIAGWESISGWQYSDVIHPSDWNRIEVNARGDHFTLRINHAVVFEFTDDRQPEGGLGMFIGIKEENPAVVWFDNFGYQPVR